MPKTKISEYSATANSNTDVASINIDEGCAPSGINNAIRAVMGHLKDFQAGTNSDSFNGPVGTTTAAAVAATTLTTSSTVTHNGGTANGVAYLNGSKVLTTGSALVFNGTNVGIGTASPQSKLHISGPTATSTAVFQVGGDSTSTGVVLEFSGGSNAFLWNKYNGYLSFGTNNAEKLRLDSSGNLGLGVTPSAWGSNFRAVEVAGGALWTDNSVAGANINLFKNAYADTNSYTYRYKASYAAFGYTQDAGGHKWLTAPSGTAGNAISFTQAMTLDASGNLGVGTTSPRRSGKVDIYGKLVVGDTGAPALEFSRDLIMPSSAGTGDLRFGGRYDGTNYATGAQITGLTTESWSAAGYGSALLFQTVANGSTTLTERMRIDSRGNLQVQLGAVMPYAPAPIGISAAATLTNAQIQRQILSTTGTTYTLTMPLGTTLETLAPWAAGDTAYDFYVINTASGTITMAINTGVTSLGGLTVATGTSAQFRIRRTAANTFILYRLG